MRIPLKTINFLTLAAMPVLMGACASPRPTIEALREMTPDPTSTPEYQQEATRILQNFREAGRAARAAGYRVAPGDDVSVSVFGREDLSGLHRVGPDGFISLAVVGDVKIGGLLRADALATIEQAFAPAYPDLAVTLGVESYTGLSVVVLGSVTAPGEYQFATAPSLLRALGEADGLKADEHEIMPQRCAIIRGKETILWINLEQLLNEGDLSLNVELLPGDVVHVTADSQRLVYVLGEVNRPGMYPLRHGMTVVDSIALAGGITEDADDDGIRLLHPSKGTRNNFNYEEFTAGDFFQDRALAKGDVVFVPRHTLAEIGWVFDQLAPLAQIFFIYEVGRN